MLSVHAANPYRFSHPERTNEEDVDLNRNFNDFTAPSPDNPVYEQIHDLLVPKGWTRPPSTIAFWNVEAAKR